MLTKVARGSVPLGGNAATLGVLPVQCNNHNVPVSYNDGTSGCASHVSTNGQYFHLPTLLGGADQFDSIVLTEISYLNEAGELNVYAIPGMRPVPYKTNRPFTVGHVTKLNNQRWGFNFNYDPKTARGQFVTDQGSPIIGVCFYLTKA